MRFGTVRALGQEIAGLVEQRSLAGTLEREWLLVMRAGGRSIKHSHFESVTILLALSQVGRFWRLRSAGI